MTEWQKEVTDKIGREVLRLRGQRSQLWLEQRTAELGHRVSRGGLSQLESGNRRSISVAEWLVLAAALDVAPVELLFPAYPAEEVEMLPGNRVLGTDAVKWISGENRLDDGELTTSATRIYALVRRLALTNERIARLSALADFGTEEELREMVQEISRDRERAQQELWSMFRPGGAGRAIPEKDHEEN